MKKQPPKTRAKPESNPKPKQTKEEIMKKLMEQEPPEIRRLRRRQRRLIDSNRPHFKDEDPEETEREMKRCLFKDDKEVSYTKYQTTPSIPKDKDFCNYVSCVGDHMAECVKAGGTLFECNKKAHAHCRTIYDIKQYDWRRKEKELKEKQKKK